jgi:hypothetical protein
MTEERNVERMSNEECMMKINCELKQDEMLKMIETIVVRKPSTNQRKQGNRYEIKTIES